MVRPEAHAFLHKPFEITDFESLIRQALAEAPQPKALEGGKAVAALGDWVALGFEGPLSSASAQVERLKAEGRADGGALETLGAQLQVMESLSREFREAAHLAARMVMLRPVRADLGVHLRHTLDAWRQAKPQVRWTLEAPASQVELRFDPARMGQVLDALLGHAARHGGEVRVELESTPSLVSVRVKDQGPGISDEELQHLFEPFRPGGTGSGLGLYIASELTRLHGGGLSVESKRGQGTTFSVILPRG